MGAWFQCGVWYRGGGVVSVHGAQSQCGRDFSLGAWFQCRGVVSHGTISKIRHRIWTECTLICCEFWRSILSIFNNVMTAMVGILAVWQTYMQPDCTSYEYFDFCVLLEPKTHYLCHCCQIFNTDFKSLLKASFTRPLHLILQSLIWLFCIW